MLKNIIISILLGIIATLLIGFAQNQPLAIPDNAPAIAQLLIIIAAIFIGGLFTSSEQSEEHYEGDEEETGTVKWFNIKKGYGFITRDQGDDVFVHYRNIEGEGRRAISEGQRVTFIVINGDKGLQADQVNAI